MKDLTDFERFYGFIFRLKTVSELIKHSSRNMTKKFLYQINSRLFPYFRFIYIEVKKSFQKVHEYSMMMTVLRLKKK